MKYLELYVKVALNIFFAVSLTFLILGVLTVGSILLIMAWIDKDLRK